MKYSVNTKLNNLLNAIEQDLLELGIEEVIRYKKEFKYEVDYNIVQYGNLLVYYDDVREFYHNHNYSVKRYSDSVLWERYKRQVGYVARKLCFKNK